MSKKALDLAAFAAAMAGGLVGLPAAGQNSTTTDVGRLGQEFG
jgi:hypothetical protein